MAFKYTAKLDNISIACYPFGHEKFQISKASLDELKKLSPEVNLEENPDLLGVSFNLAVPNMINNNGDGISGATASKIAKRFIHKYLNIEHNKERVVGHITNYSFNRLSDNSFMSEEEAAQTLDPFYLSVAGVIYRTVDRKFTSLMVRNSDPKDSFYNSISASWEIGLNKYYIAAGSKVLKEADIITDPKLLQELSPYLKSKGGSGKLKDGTPIYRIIVGDVYPLGGGFTTNPAAQVNGVVAFDQAVPMSLEDDEEEDVPNQDENYENDEKVQAVCLEQVSAFLANKKSNSILARKNVKTINHMDLEKLIAELKSALLEKKFGEEAVASMTSQFAEAIKQKDAEYRDSIAAEKTAKEKAEKLYNDTVTSVEVIKAELAKTQEELNKIKEAKIQEEAVARLNARVGELDAAYELNDDDRKLILDEVKNLDASETSFASYKEKFAAIWKHKNKEFIKAQAEEIEKKISEQVEARLKEVSKASVASAEVKTEEKKADVAAALENATATNKAPDSKVAVEQSFREKFAKAFSRENISVSYSK